MELEYQQNIRQITQAIEKRLNALQENFDKHVYDIQRELNALKGENNEYDTLMAGLYVIYKKQGKSTRNDLAELMVSYRDLHGGEIWNVGMTNTLNKIATLIRTHDIKATFGKGKTIFLEPMKPREETKYKLKHYKLLFDTFEEALTEHKEIKETVLKTEETKETEEDRTIEQKNIVDQILKEVAKEKPKPKKPKEQDEEIEQMLRQFDKEHEERKLKEAEEYEKTTKEN